MATNDGFVQVAPDSTGKKIDNSQLTRADGTVVQRQRVVISDDIDPTLQAKVRDGNVYIQADAVLDHIAELVTEVRMIKDLLFTILGKG